MAVCEDAPCCGCCGRNLYYDAWAEPDDLDPYDDFDYDPWADSEEPDESYCPVCDGLHDVCPLEQNDEYRWEVEQDELRAMF